MPGISGRSRLGGGRLREPKLLGKGEELGRGKDLGDKPKGKKRIRYKRLHRVQRIDGERVFAGESVPFALGSRYLSLRIF